MVISTLLVIFIWFLFVLHLPTLDSSWEMVYFFDDFIFKSDSVEYRITSTFVEYIFILTILCLCLVNSMFANIVYLSFNCVTLTIAYVVCSIESSIRFVYNYIYIPAPTFYTSYYLSTYNIFFIYLVITVLISSFLITVSFFVSEQKIYLDNINGYECGFDPFSDARDPFAINFFLISILFIIFDIELLFFYPWSISILYTSLFGFYIMYLFFLILTLVFIYEWIHNCLIW